MKKIALKDIARKAGVSPSTASFVLNGKGKKMRISETLVKKIKGIAEKHGYQPNQVAVSLRTGKTKTLGLIVENISDSFFSLLAKIIEDEAETHGYKIVYCSTENDLTRARSLIRMLSQRQVDGFLITPTEGLEEDIEQLIRQKKPVVLMDRYFPNVNVPFVLVDNYSGTKKGVTHLVQKGYKNIGYVTVDLDLIQMQQREKAYTDVLQANGIKVQKKLMLKLPYNSENSEDATDKICKFISDHKEMEAVFFATNYLGIYGLECMRRLKLTIPKDLAVMCFDDHDIFRLYPPGITVIQQPIVEIAKTSVQLLMEQLEDKNNNVQKKEIQLPAHFLIRNST